MFATFIGFSGTQMLLDRKPKPSRRLPGVPGMVGAGTGIGVVSSLVGRRRRLRLGAVHDVVQRAECTTPWRRRAALGFPIALAGTIGYVVAGWSMRGMPNGTLGFVYLPALRRSRSRAWPTAPLGARVAHGLDVVLLKRIFAVMLYSVAAFMLYRSIVD